MMASVQIPRILQQYAAGRGELAVEGASVREVLGRLNALHPELYRCICNETGSVRQHIHVFVNNDQVMLREGRDVGLNPGDVVSVFQAVSGG